MNIAAERLRNRIRQDHGDHDDCKFLDDLEAALAEARRITVEEYAPIISEHPWWEAQNCCNRPGCGDEDYFEHVRRIADNPHDACAWGGACGCEHRARTA